MILPAALGPILSPNRMTISALLKSRATPGKNTRPATEQGKDTTRPTTKQGMKPRPVASLPMSIMGRLPRPLGKTAAIHTIRPIQWYDECTTMDPWFVEAVSATLAIPAPDRTPEQRVVFRRHWHAIRDAQTPLFHVEEEMPDDF